MQESVDAILMASGFSSRFEGGNKLLAAFRGKPLMMHTVDLVAESGLFRNIFAVCADEEIVGALKSAPVLIIRNARPGRGQCESIRLGVAASRADHFLFFPCDQPFLDRPTLELILSKRQNGRIVVPCFEDRPGSPVLFSDAFRGELMALRDGEGGKTVLSRHPGAVTTVQLPAPHPLEDIDTREDLFRLSKSAPGNS